MKSQPFNNREKLNHRINAFVVTESLKNKLIQISELEDIMIHQTVRKLLDIATTQYFENPDFKFTKRNNFLDLQ